MCMCVTYLKWLICLSDEDRENVSLLISSLKSNGVVTSDNFMEVRNAVLVLITDFVNIARQSQSTEAIISETSL